MSDTSDKDAPEDGTVILTNAPPKLRPPGSGRASQADVGSDATRGMPAAPPKIAPRSSSPPASPNSAVAVSPAPAVPTPPASPDDEDEGGLTQVLHFKEPQHQSTVSMQMPPPPLGSPPAAAPAQPRSAPPTQNTDALSKQRAPQAPSQSTQRVPATPRSSREDSSGADESRFSDSTEDSYERPAEDATVTWSTADTSPWITLERTLPADQTGRETIDRKVTVIGRSLESDLRLYSASSSRKHAQIEQRDDGWYLVPIAGRAVMVDEKNIDQETLLRDGMRLAFGDDELVVVDQQEPQQNAGMPRTLGWKPVVLAILGAGTVVFLVLRLLDLL